MEEPNNFNFRNYSTQRWEDPYNFGRLSFQHKNSFEALIDQKENEYRQEELGNCDTNRVPRPLYFEYCTNPREETLANHETFNNDSVEELHLGCQYSCSHDTMMDAADENLERQDDYWAL